MKIVFIISIFILLTGCTDNSSLYNDCINECSKTRICIERLPGKDSSIASERVGECIKYSDTSNCKNICIEKYK